MNRDILSVRVLRVLVCVLFIALVASIVLGKPKFNPNSMDDAKGEFTPGTYTATANGFGGDVEVTVTIGDNGGISVLIL